MMSDDLISRQAAIDELKECRKIYCDNTPESFSLLGHSDKSRVDEIDNAIAILVDLPSAQRWIPVKTRPMTEEERNYYAETLGWDLTDDEAIMFDCKMPEDGQEIWVCSKCGDVWEDACIVDDGIGLEGNGNWLDIMAWMPFEKPKPYKEKDDGEEARLV